MTRPLAATALILLALMSDALAANDYNEVVTAVNESAKTFSCSGGPGHPSYIYMTTNKTVIRTSEQSVRLSHLWHRGHFSDIQVGKIVSIRWHLRGDERIADRVIVYPAKK